MNERRLAYYPVLLYSLLLLLVWIGSWLMGVVHLFTGGTGAVSSLMSSEGVRWTLLNVQGVLRAAPWGTFLFLIVIAGLLHGSGLLQFVADVVRGKASSNEWRSFLFSQAALMLYAAILFLFTVSPWDTMRGVTGGLVNSPFSHGWLLVLFFGVLMTSLVYGFMYGNYRTMMDVVSTSGALFARSAPALMAMLPAAAIMPAMNYTGLASMLGIDAGYSVFLELALYTMPFVYLFCLGVFGKR